MFFSLVTVCTGCLLSGHHIRRRPVRFSPCTPSRSSTYRGHSRPPWSGHCLQFAVRGQKLQRNCRGSRCRPFRGHRGLPCRSTRTRLRTRWTRLLNTPGSRLSFLMTTTTTLTPTKYIVNDIASNIRSRKYCLYCNYY